ncbi:peptidase M22, glycoprotease [Violaceomyces palustris]|uniref:Peptidase M22, glycoprotease n=1 Tax=Violaceomyces palustris TaxID=1673888 RepID=A0ACD0NP74_9BASI|nr:peptidase M22, glycoprotease [Violaceomyces palustris]
MVQGSIRLFHPTKLTPLSPLCRESLHRYPHSAFRRITTTCERLEPSPNGESKSENKVRLILGIESSCDDSCASIVSSRREVLSSVVTKQDHSSTNGIHPLHAALNHNANLPKTIVEAFNQAGLHYADVDAVAVTRGPGMASSLGVGLTCAKTFSSLFAKPLIYVHHMQAHALTPLLTEKTGPSFPFLTLLVSGGHTMLVLAKGINEFSILATTGDDSIGDAFDKVARDLEIPWTSAPGSALEATARGYQESMGSNHPIPKSTFPVPMKGRPAFSYSGLKSSVSRHIESKGGPGNLSASQRSKIAFDFQSTAISQLEDKVTMALKIDRQEAKPFFKPPPAGTEGERLQVWRDRQEFRQKLGDASKIKSLVCSGGVASNSFLRSRLRKCLDEMGRQDVVLMFPPPSLCTDNAAMIAFTGHLLWDQRTFDHDRHARPKWSLQDL